jgi:hypothetical protein
VFKKVILSAVLSVTAVTGVVATDVSAMEIPNASLDITQTKSTYTWGVDTYVQSRITNTNWTMYHVTLQPQRYMNGVWSDVSGINMYEDVAPGETLINNQLIAANGSFKAKGTYRYKYVLYYDDVTGTQTNLYHGTYYSPSFIIK